MAKEKKKKIVQFVISYYQSSHICDHKKCPSCCKIVGPQIFNTFPNFELW